MKHTVRKAAAAILLFAIVISSLALGATTASAASSSSQTLTGKGDGSFTVAAMNVDGLPREIRLAEELLGENCFKVDLNPDGPGAGNTPKIGKKMAAAGWDIIGLSENFNYGDQLKAEMSGYKWSTPNKETIPEKLTALEIDSTIKSIPFDTDGLSLAWKSSVKVTENDVVPWADSHSTYERFGGTFFGLEIYYDLPTGSGADDLIRKGFRYFTAEVASGVSIDVYIMHMDAEDNPEDFAARANQIRQLAKYILESNTKNPVIIMGDLNCRYPRDDLKKLLIDAVSADPRFTAQDAWIEYAWGGVYPAKGSPSLGGYPFPKREIVDKLIYINNTESNIHLRLDSYSVDTSFTNSDGSALADHWPIIGKFTYAKKHTIKYVDGVGGKAFSDVVISDALTGNKTPAFPGGTPTRQGYVFNGWSPSVASTVKGDTTYTATWKKAPETTAPPSRPGTTTTETSPPKVTEPAVTTPQATEPPVTEPPVTEPPVTEPVETEPVETEPVEVTPVETGPAETEPDGAPTETTETDTAPDVTEPPVTGATTDTASGDTQSTDDGGLPLIPIIIVVLVVLAGAAATVGVLIYKRGKSGDNTEENNAE